LNLKESRLDYSILFVVAGALGLIFIVRSLERLLAEVTGVRLLLERLEANKSLEGEVRSILEELRSVSNASLRRH
jgi:hypothetical protein